MENDDEDSYHYSDDELEDSEQTNPEQLEAQRRLEKEAEATRKKEEQLRLALEPRQNYPIFHNAGSGRPMSTPPQSPPRRGVLGAVMPSVRMDRKNHDGDNDFNGISPSTSIEGTHCIAK